MGISRGYYKKITLKRSYSMKNVITRGDSLINSIAISNSVINPISRGISVKMGILGNFGDFSPYIPNRITPGHLFF